jgi:hypothetical protein
LQGVIRDEGLRRLSERFVIGAAADGRRACVFVLEILRGRAANEGGAAESQREGARQAESVQLSI